MSTVPADARNFLSSVDAAIDRLSLLGEFPMGCDVPRLLSSILGFEVNHRSIADRRERVSAAQAALVRLLASPGIPQRTPEWYDARTTMITASDIAQALGCAKFGTQRQFFEKKCGHVEPPPFDPTVPPLRWGIMFEPVACHLYSMLNAGVRVHEFGLLRHPTVPFLGASPDGITEHGVMLEIKCPWRRKIGHEVPTQYYYQIQGQLSVCGLEDCDFFECEFEDVFDPAVLYEGDDQPFGVLLETTYDDRSPNTYVYPPFDRAMSLEEMKRWASQTEGKCSIENEKTGGSRTTAVWWRLVRHGTIRVSADHGFVEGMLEQLANVWERVQRYKTDRTLYDAEVATVPKRGSSRLPSAPSAQNELTGAYAFVDDS